MLCRIEWQHLILLLLKLCMLPLWKAAECDMGDTELGRYSNMLTAGVGNGLSMWTSGDVSVAAAHGNAFYLWRSSSTWHSTPGAYSAAQVTWVYT